MSIAVSWAMCPCVYEHYPIFNEARVCQNILITLLSNTDGLGFPALPVLFNRGQGRIATLARFSRYSSL